MVTMKSFVSIIDGARRKKKMTIKTLADMCGVSLASMNRYIGARVNTPFDMAVKMAKAVDVSIDEIFELGKGDLQISDFFRMISGLLTTRTESAYVTDFDMKGQEAIIITPEAFHGVVDFEAWAKLIDLYRRNIVPEEMYDAWVEKKSNELAGKGENA